MCSQINQILMKRKRNIFDRIGKLIPGYTGYADRSDRRKKEKKFRVLISSHLSHDEGNSADHLLLGDDLLFTKIASFDSGAERAPKRTKLDILLEDHHEVLIEVQNGNLSYKDATEVLNDLGLSVSDGTLGRALKRLEQQQ